MQRNLSDTPQGTRPAKRRRLDHSSSREYSNAERRVLQHAADILGVTLDVLLALNAPLNEILSSRARSPPKRNTVTEEQATIPPPAHQATLDSSLSCHSHLVEYNGPLSAHWQGNLLPTSRPSISNAPINPTVFSNGFNPGILPVDWLSASLSIDQTSNFNATGVFPDFGGTFACLDEANGLTTPTQQVSNDLYEPSNALHNSQFRASSDNWAAQDQSANGIETPNGFNLPSSHSFGGLERPIEQLSQPASSFTNFPAPVAIESRIFGDMVASDAVSASTSAAANQTRSYTLWRPNSHEDEVFLSHSRVPSGRRATQTARGQARGRRGASRNEQERQFTRHTRQVGACAFCKVQKVRCIPEEDPKKPCGTCLKRAAALNQQPLCSRLKITDASLFDKGPHPQYIWSRRWKSMDIVEINEWASNEVKTVKITQGVGDTSYKLRVREFRPQTGDSLERKWKSNGELKSHRCAPYAIANMGDTGLILKKFVDDNIDVTIQHSINTADSLLCLAYENAWKLAFRADRDDEKKLFQTLLRLWTAIRMESRSEQIIGDEHLGMLPQRHDMNYHNYGKYLIPPVMSAQIELITTANILYPWRKLVLEELQKMITDKKKTHWFSIFLCIFILLHSCAMLTAFQEGLAKKYGATTRYVYPDFVKELHNGAKIMLIYFHSCNQGFSPFSPFQMPSFIKTAGLNEEQAHFLRAVADAIKKRGQFWEALKSNGRAEDDFYFISQLFDEDWRPPG